MAPRGAVWLLAASLRVTQAALPAEPPPPPVPAKPHECDIGYDHWQTAWSDSKKAWCCEDRDRGCPPPSSTSASFDCTAALSNWEDWSEDKKSWCCRTKGKGCPVSSTTTSSAPYDCEAGYANWKAGWTKGKKAWCCIYRKRGCPGTTSTTVTTTYSPAYDCKAGLAHWEDGWSAPKKVWCCEQVQKGCPGTEGSPATTTPPATTTYSAAYDCEAGLANWVKGWSAPKKVWCCEQAQQGCEGSEDQVTSTTTTSPAYDCEAGLSNSAAGWSSAKKVWCCEKERKGCKGSKGGGCQTPCGFGGQIHTCGERVSYMAKRPPLVTDGRMACTRAFALVLKQCATECTGCALSDTGCAAPTVIAPTAAPVVVVPSVVAAAAPAAVAACDVTCSYLGKSATCAFRVQWGANHKYLGQERACMKAYGMVLSQCPCCHRCTWEVIKPRCTEQEPTSPAPATTTTATLLPTSVPYDCLAGLSNWREGWSESKKDWCCENRARGCPATSTSVPFDCLAGYSNWQKGWSESKKEWCCEHRSRGCPDTTVISMPYDCLAGYSNWVKGWSSKKKLWCCQHRQKGCRTPATVTITTTTSKPPYDCQAGLSNWLMGWTIEKKDWCCKVEQVHCKASAEYNCEAGLDKWEAGWSEGKKLWCCKNTGKGCKAGEVISRKFAQRPWSEWAASQAHRGKLLQALPWFLVAGLVALGSVGVIRKCARSANRSGAERACREVCYANEDDEAEACRLPEAPALARVRQYTQLNQSDAAVE